MISVIAKDNYCPPAPRSGIFWTKIYLPIHVQSHALSAIQQVQLYAIVFQNVLAPNQISGVEEATYNPLIGHEDFLWTKKQQAICGGMMGKSSLLCPARTRIDPVLASTIGTRRCANGCDTPFRDWHPECYDRSQKSYPSSVEFDRKIITSLSSI